MSSENNKIRAIAAYLPQFHPIPENDKWWGKGFTEWTNVTKAKPLFKNHWQPRLPADLGLYDLRVPETRDAQANLARQYGIEGFMYWHYWFGGKRIIERPFSEVVQSGQPDFPFCVAWANQTWQGTWHGISNKEILIEQTYPGVADHTAHFYCLLSAFQDKRYIEVNEKKLVFIFNPTELPEPARFVELWQNLAIKEGLKGIHFVALHTPMVWEASLFGFDAVVPGFLNRNKYKKSNLQENLQRKLFSHKTQWITSTKKPDIISYKAYVNDFPEFPLTSSQYPWILADWDNTPRVGVDGWLFDSASPELFGELCTRAFKATENKNSGEKLVILRSWNEWAEGNYLEPDRKYGAAYLEQFQKSLNAYNNS